MADTRDLLRNMLLGDERMPNTVPVLIDSIKDQDGFKMARCMYFSIECDTPSPGWELGLESGSIPFLMLGLSGIITKPLRGDSFKSVEDIESLFESIENHEGLYIDINDIWLPLKVFADQEYIKRSGLYRIPFRLFGIAYDYTSGRISMEEYLQKVGKYQPTRAGKLIRLEEGKEPLEEWRFESEGAESEIFLSWEFTTIEKRRQRKIKLHEAHESLALGRKPEKFYE